MKDNLSPEARAQWNKALELIREQRAYEQQLAKHLCEENPKLGFSQALAQAERFTRPKE